MWCFSSNATECEKMEQELESRGIDLTAENVQAILLED
jgi:hypothetical protein